MPAQKGRSFQIKKGGVVLAGIQTKSAPVTNEPIDITSDDDLGFRTFHDETGMKSLDATFEGVTKDTILRGIIMAGGTAAMLTDITLNYPNGDVVAGNFYLSNLDENGETAGAMKFSGTLQSSGPWTYTPAA